ncbi:endonuclease V [Paenibacillus polymyxa]|uniref:deoxyribonuclease V n=1 Tax=Paenibacillus jamilae TaxID=114136 RepID=UPI0007AB87F0|nr:MULTISPECIES: deoxyribonuclease V [Paenibacillus]KZE65736.1 endonuclease V [Paenibacillus jamilae]OBA04497.1 endonuclease V [Paenibacillus polymyxa]
MKPVLRHNWDLAETEAIKLQQELSKKVTKEDQFPEIHYVAGVDVAYSEQSDLLVAAIVILEAHSLNIVESVVVEDSVQFPYISGLFSFRELPSIVKAFRKIKTFPQLVVCDGQGIAHPRRFGLASHLGVIFDIPTIGCGKTKLLGDFQEPSKERGACSLLMNREEIIGSVLRTQENIKPLFVSVGHRISLETACNWILKLSPRYRLPETTRQADQLVKKVLSKIY